MQQVRAGPVVLGLLEGLTCVAIGFRLCLLREEEVANRRSCSAFNGASSSGRVLPASLRPAAAWGSTFLTLNAER